MSDADLFDAVAQETGEDSHEIRRRGFVLTGPADAKSNFRGPRATTYFQAWNCVRGAEARRVSSSSHRIPLVFLFNNTTQRRTHHHQRGKPWTAASRL